MSDQPRSEIARPTEAPSRGQILARRWAWALDERERTNRPERVARLTFAMLAARQPGYDPYRLIPMESVRAGDEQVLVSRGIAGEPVPVDLDPLAAYPTVRSVVASTVVVSREPLRQLRELLLVGSAAKPIPDPGTLRHLTDLETFWAGVAPYRAAIDLDALPAGTLRELGVERARLGQGSGAAGLEALAGFRQLRHLVVEGCYPTDSMAPLAGLTELVRLRASAPAGWPALASCRRLEEVEAYQPRLRDLRPLESWRHLRRLTISAGSLSSLQGVEVFRGLESLTLVALSVADLAPLGDLPALADVRLLDIREVRDLAPLAALPSLRCLTFGGDIVATPELERSLAALQASRPDLRISYRPRARSKGIHVGVVTVHPPVAGITRWWLLQDLSRLFQVPTNADAEATILAALAVEDPVLSGRLGFDTEADAVGIDAPTEADIRAVAGLISRLTEAKRRLASKPP